MEAIDVLAGSDGGDGRRLVETIGKRELEQDAVQCGMCFPGILMALTGLLERRPDASEAEIRTALAGNICRCTGYERIVTAALAAGAALRQPEGATP